MKSSGAYTRPAGVFYGLCLIWFMVFCPAYAGSPRNRKTPNDPLRMIPEKDAESSDVAPVTSSRYPTARSSYRRQKIYGAPIPRSSHHKLIAMAIRLRSQG